MFSFLCRLFGHKNGPLVLDTKAHENPFNPWFPLDYHIVSFCRRCQKSYIHASGTAANESDAERLYRRYIETRDRILEGVH